MNVSIVIPNFNGKELLLRNIPKILVAVEGYKGGDIEFIIADDASNDGSIEAVRPLLEKLIPPSRKNISYQIIKNTGSKNKGFSSNVNSGVEKATGDIIILLNTDVYPHKDFLDPLLAHFKNPLVFAVGCMDESVEEEGIVLRGRGVGKWEKGFLHHAAGSLDNPHTLWVSGGSSAFRKSMWEKLGGLNDLYNPFYWEDIDLSYRAQKAGFFIVFEKKSVVCHEHSKGAIKTFYKPFRVKLIVYRNQFLFTWLNLTDTMLIAQHIFWLPYHIAREVKHKDVAFFCGLFMAILRIPKVIEYRLRMRKLWKRTDQEVIQLTVQ